MVEIPKTIHTPLLIAFSGTRKEAIILALHQSKNRPVPLITKNMRINSSQVDTGTARCIASSRLPAILTGSQSKKP